MYAKDDFEEVYSGEGREDLVDNDEITASEEAFMKGYDEDQRASDEGKNSDKAYDSAFDTKRRSRRSKNKADIFDEEDLESDTLMQ